MGHLSGMGESCAIPTPIFIARQANSPESFEFLIRANHPIRANRANRFARITPLSGSLCTANKARICLEGFAQFFAQLPPGSRICRRNFALGNVRRNDSRQLLPAQLVVKIQRFKRNAQDLCRNIFGGPPSQLSPKLCENCANTTVAQFLHKCHQAEILTR